MTSNPKKHFSHITFTMTFHPFCFCFTFVSTLHSVYYYFAVCLLNFSRTEREESKLHTTTEEPENDTFRYIFMHISNKSKTTTLLWNTLTRETISYGVPHTFVHSVSTVISVSIRHKNPDRTILLILLFCLIIFLHSTEFSVCFCASNC